MRKIIHLFFFGLFFVSCSKSSAPVAEEETSDGSVPVALNLPGAYFTDPATVAAGQSSNTIMDKVIGILKAAPAGDSLHLSIYLMDYPSLEEEIIKAHQRGVAVKMMVDRSREESVQLNSMLIARLRSKLPAPSEVVVTESDASASAINHNKFILASAVNITEGERKHITFQTSHNWIVSGTKKMQDALVFSNEGLYKAFHAYWSQMRARAASGMNLYHYSEYHDPALKLTAFFFPKRRNGTAYGDDTVIEMLNNITSPENATVRIGMSDWVKSRINVAEKLLDLREKGAKVELVVKSSIDTEIQTVLKQIQEKGGFVKMYNMNQPGPKINIHAKFLLIEGSWKGKNEKVLITGSHNFTTNALRNNNEVMLQWENAPLYDDYITWFNALKTQPGINF